MKRSATRYYSEEDTEVGVTRSQLRRMSRLKQIKYMCFWFKRHYENPQNETPYSKEDGYRYVFGGPYDASNELQNQFGGFIEFDRIEEAINKVESDGIYEWAPGLEHADHESERQESEAENTQNVQEIELQELIKLFQNGEIPTFGTENELNQRQAILTELAKLDEALAPFKPIHGAIGHNNPPSDDALIKQRVLPS